MVSWLKTAIFYQVYPASFYDSNGDGTGDLKGITLKLDYLKDLGINAIWLNPFYKSPFKDGGYDIEDYYKVDERFGVMQDFEELVSECKKRDLKLIIDLVIGHTSTENKWFKESAKDEINKYSDYYIWTDSIFSKYKDKTIHGLYPRNGGYYVNYYACQPALNFGFNKTDDGGTGDNYDNGSAWQMHYTDARLKPLREEILNIMRFWMNKGIDGFRVDMANSLVKGCVYDSEEDEDIEGNRWLWDILIGTIKKEYGEDVAFISEWVNPVNAVYKCGFDVDFFTHDIPCYNELFRNEPKSNLLPTFEKGYSFFGKDGKGCIKNFIEYALKLNDKLRGKGYYSLPTGSHDQVRLAERKNEDLLKCVFAFLLTWTQVPFIYYGDELGIKHNYSVNKDGGYIRTGARTPMLWSENKNKGFSTADEIYLPIDEKTESVKLQENIETSLLNAVKKLCKLRKTNTCLNADAKLTVEEYGDDYIFYSRSDGESRIRVLIKNGKGAKSVKTGDCEILFSNNAEKDNDGNIILKNAAFAIIKG